MQTIPDEALDRIRRSGYNQGRIDGYDDGYAKGLRDIRGFLIAMVTMTGCASLLGVAIIWRWVQ